MRLALVVLACLCGMSSAWHIADRRETREALLQLLGMPQQLAREFAEAPNEFKWDDCGGSGSTIKFNSISVGPDPVVLPGNVTAAFSVTATANIESPIKAAVILEKKVLAWIKIPCIDQIGSCDYDDLCSFLPSGACPELLQKYKIPCHCPFAAGTYTLPSSVIPVQVGPLPSWLTNGDYHGKATMSDGSGKELGCVEAYVSLKAA